MAITTVWQSIGLVSSGFTLIAFICAVIAWIYKIKSENEANELKNAPDNKRVELVLAKMAFFNVDTKKLSKEQQYSLALAQINHRASKLKIQSLVICIIGVILAIVTAYAISINHDEKRDENTMATSPIEAATMFYDWYYSKSEENRHNHKNPYSQSELISTSPLVKQEFVEKISRSEMEELLDSDPVFCAQDVPVEYGLKLQSSSLNNAIVGFYWEKSTKPSGEIFVQKIGNQWKIKNIDCNYDAEENDSAITNKQETVIANNSDIPKNNNTPSQNTTSATSATSAILDDFISKIRDTRDKKMKSIIKSEARALVGKNINFGTLYATSNDDLIKEKMLTKFIGYDAKSNKLRVNHQYKMYRKDSSGIWSIDNTFTYEANVTINLNNVFKLSRAGREGFSLECDGIGSEMCVFYTMIKGNCPVSVVVNGKTSCDKGDWHFSFDSDEGGGTITNLRKAIYTIMYVIDGRPTI
ncbi:TPA: DUF3828 domain-containing protein [Klebsiella quasipneumoniae subsp. similipneumoniae]|nr:DUF3828 domain-containing protein [Klebsiella quasipneumoniae subsp. similipneumoniae]